MEEVENEENNEPQEAEKEPEPEPEEEIPDNNEDVTFISRFFLLPDELYKKEKYLLSIMRISIFERILNTYLFQSSSKELSLYPFWKQLKKSKRNLNF